MKGSRSETATISAEEMHKSIFKWRSNPESRPSRETWNEETKKGRADQQTALTLVLYDEHQLNADQVR